LLVLALIVLAVAVAATGGIRERVWGIRISIRSVERVLFWAAAVFALRHVLVPRPSAFTLPARPIRLRPIRLRPRAVAAFFTAAALLAVIGVVWSTREQATPRELLFRELRPVRLENCTLQRFGERHDGGYLLCGNLLGEVRTGYSYGISGYDGWGCDVSKALGVVVHQYDCFNLTVPTCAGGATRFHGECVAARWSRDDGRLFDTVASQVARNGDEGKAIVLKMDVEGAEWQALPAMPDTMLDSIDQLVVEFHGVNDPNYVEAVRRLKQFFHVAHVHYNNYACDPRVEPFPASVYEVLFVSRRLGRLDQAGTALSKLGLLGPPSTPRASPNDPRRPDCQTR
jgi:hypothetical protein